MKSKAVLLGHPVHPMLIPFPFAFLTGAFVFDALGTLTDRPTLWTTGGHLAGLGILTALLAAVPGVIDYLFTVPPNSSGKQRATKHMIVNLTTGERVAHFAEVDVNETEDLDRQAVYLRPAKRLAGGHRFAVGQQHRLRRQEAERAARHVDVPDPEPRDQDRPSRERATDGIPR